MKDKINGKSKRRNKTKKKLIAVILVVFTLLNVCCIGAAAVSADDAREEPLRYSSISSIDCELTFNGVQGIISCNVDCYSNVTRITATLKLYYKSGFTWLEMPVSWTFDVNDDILIINKNFYGASGVQYKIVLNVKAYRGTAYETATASDIKT